MRVHCCMRSNSVGYIYIYLQELSDLIRLPTLLLLFFPFLVQCTRGPSSAGLFPLMYTLSGILRPTPRFTSPFYRLCPALLKLVKMVIDWTPRQTSRAQQRTHPCAADRFYQSIYCYYTLSALSLSLSLSRLKAQTEVNRNVVDKKNCH